MIKVKIVDENTYQYANANTLDKKDWYEIEREPNPFTETLRYDVETDSVLIEKRTITPEQIAAREKATEDTALMKADTIRDLRAEIEALKTRLAAIESAKEPV